MAEIKATGSACYDTTGLTYPIKQSINWGTIPCDVTWKAKVSNQPEEITFSSDNYEIVKQWLNDNYPDSPLLVVDYN